MKLNFFTLSFIFTNILLAQNPLDKLTSLVSRGNEGGNGGDQVREFFITTGRSILVDYREQIIKELGEEVTNKVTLNLSIEMIKLSGEVLLDNTNSIVSAIGDKSGITLYVGEEYSNLSWSNIIQQGEVSKVLVLHEILRLAAINDDNFVISNKILKPSYKTNIDQIIELPKTKSPFNRKQMRDLGIAYSVPPSTKCGHIESYKVVVTTKFRCDASTMSCVGRNVWTGDDLYEFSLLYTEKNLKFISETRKTSIKATLSCTYQREVLDDCHSFEAIKSVKDCSLLFAQAVSTDGILSIQPIQKQQQQQQQQQEAALESEIANER